MKLSVVMIAMMFWGAMAFAVGDPAFEIGPRDGETGSSMATAECNDCLYPHEDALPRINSESSVDRADAVLGEDELFPGADPAGEVSEGANRGG